MIHNITIKIKDVTSMLFLLRCYVLYHCILIYFSSYLFVFMYVFMCVHWCIFVYIFVHLCIFLYIRTYLQKMRRAICDKKIPGVP